MLDRLEVYNFKSYRGKQTIGPFRNFSAVIGPNGAGKSNLMDAISFVLGVRSSSLRSSALKDLVYRSGKTSGKGKGKAANQEGDGESESDEGEQDVEEDDEEDGERKAYVIAVYVDEDDEWKFQRSISTAGTSEYRLNNKSVTYKVYNDQLEKFNILVKAKNFLVFQGDVEAVASQSPKDLAKLIDQISGSLDHKAEYDAASTALDRATEASVNQHNRRKGVNGEIKQFKEMKKEAERWKSLGQERDAAVLKHLLWKLYHVEAGISSNVQEIEEKNESLTALRENHSTYDDAQKAAKKEVVRAQKDVTKQEKVVKTQEKALDDAKPELVAIDAKMAHAAKNLKKAELVTKTVEGELATRQAAADRFQQDLAGVQKAVARHTEKQRKDAESKGLVLSESDLKEYHELKSTASLKAISERQSLNKLTQEQKTKNDGLATAADKLDVAQRKLRTLTGEESTLQERKSDLDTKLGQLQTNLAKSKKELSDLQARKTRTAQTETELNEKLAQALGVLSQVGADKHQSEKEAKLKETLQNLKRTFPGVKGRLVDLVKPSSNKYSTSVMTVLGRNIDSVVVDNEKTSISCIEYLRVQRLSPITFLPLATITANPVSEKFRSFARGARLAIDCVEYHVSYEKAVQFACGNALICDTMEIARHVCYDKAQEVKAVTLEGTVIHKGGNITGGVAGGSDRREFASGDVEAARAKVEDLRTKLGEIYKNKPRGNAEEPLLNEITRLESESTLLRDDLSATVGRIATIQAEIKVHNTSVKKLTAEVASLTSDLETIEASAAKRRKVIDKEEESIFSKFCRRIKVANIREYEEKQLKGAQGDNELKLQFETQIARLGHQIKFETEQISSMQERIAGLEATATKERATVARLALDKETTQAEHEALQVEIDSAKDALEELTAVLIVKTTAFKEVKKQGSKSARALDKVLKEIAACNDEIERLAADRFAVYRRCKLEELELPLNQGSLNDIPIEVAPVVNQMDVDGDEAGTQQIAKLPDYGVEVDFEALDEDEQADGSEKAEEILTSHISKLTSELEKMSPNMKAIERLGDSETRFKNIDAEFETARETSKTAKDRFTALKKKRCDLFNKAYSHISDRIDVVYKDLTKGKSAPMGGIAYLSLEDSEEPYLHGIKYHAMPPMKRFRDMDQLSGGEKTMAALALLFAIHSYHPSPFFVLDEVDAALDATNVGRIARYCKKLAKPEFQFIVISLKVAFYENAAALVGIYRDGGSKTLTLDLEQYAE